MSDLAQLSGQLPILDCHGCGVCCFHMGYPAYILPQPPMTEEEIESDEVLSRRVKNNPRLKSELLAGRPGESHWHRLPAALKAEWQDYVDSYQLPNYDGSVNSLDGPCIWLDMDTRQCKNHEYRPNICRDFKTGSQACHDWRKHYSDKISATP